MRTKLIVVLFASVVMITGCAKEGVQEVSPSATKQLLYSQSGIVKSIRLVAIKDKGAGTFIGGIAGTVLGSLIGRGKGSTLASLLGGLSGAYVGNEVAKANAQELSVILDNGEEVIVIAKGNRFHKGQHIKIIKNGDSIVNVEGL